MITLPIDLGATVFCFHFEDENLAVVRYQYESISTGYTDVDDSERVMIKLNSLEEGMPDSETVLLAFDSDKMLLKSTGFVYFLEIAADAQIARWLAEDYSF